MKMKHGVSLALVMGVVISLFGTGVTAEAAVVTGGNALGGFSVVSNDFFATASEENIENAADIITLNVTNIHNIRQTIAFCY